MESYMKEDKGARIQAPVCNRQTAVELTCDVTLPDYKPEIRRLLSVRTKVVPPDHYVGAGSADFSGTVHYTILYVGSDGALYCLDEVGNYQFAVPIEAGSDFEWNEGLVADCRMQTESVGGRVAAPRKIAIRGRLRAHVKLLGTRRLEESISGIDPGATERLCGQIDAARVFTGRLPDLRLGDEILCDAGAGDLRVIASEGQVFITEATAKSACVSCHGEVALKLLTVRDGTAEAPTSTTRRIPFSCEIPTDGAEINCDACAWGICPEVSVTVEDGRILCEVSVCLSAQAQRNESIPYTRDIYSTEATCEAKFRTLPVVQAGVCHNGNLSLNTTRPLSEIGIGSGAEVIDLFLSPLPGTLECSNGKYVLSGVCQCSLILCEAGEYSLQELEIPLRYACDGTKLPAGDWHAEAQVISSRARVDGERIAVDAELALALATRCDAELRALSEARFEKLAPHRTATITICYPSREDTLWSVAKRYRRSVHTIAGMNELSDAPRADAPESLAGVTYLLV